MIKELGIGNITAVKPQAADIFSPFGKPIKLKEVEKRLSKNLYAQLADGSDDTVKDAITRASIYVGAVLRRLGVAYNIDDKIVREVVLLYTIYELHIALGHPLCLKRQDIQRLRLLRPCAFSIAKRIRHYFANAVKRLFRCP